MKVSRAGRTYEFVDDESTAHQRFWSEQFGDSWEEPTRQVIIQACRPGLDYVDIGAWVGPTVMWGAPLSRRCVAVEPDPVAAASLRANVAANRLGNVTVVEAAMSSTSGVADLEQGWDGWGDSVSSLLRRDEAKPTRLVSTLTLADLWSEQRIGQCSLVKIDIEGGEAALLPAAGDFLADLRCPILLSLHLRWLSGQQQGDVDAALERFDREVVDATDEEFPTVLLTVKS